MCAHRYAPVLARGVRPVPWRRVGRRRAFEGALGGAGAGAPAVARVVDPVSEQDARRGERTLARAVASRARKREDGLPSSAGRGEVEQGARVPSSQSAIRVHVEPVRESLGHKRPVPSLVARWRRRPSRLAHVVEGLLVRMRRAAGDSSDSLLDLVDQPLLRRRACDEQRAGPVGAVATDLSLLCQGQKRGTLLLVDEGWEDEDERVLAYHLDFLARALRHLASVFAPALPWVRPPTQRAAAYLSPECLES